MLEAICCAFSPSPARNCWRSSRTRAAASACLHPADAAMPDLRLRGDLRPERRALCRARSGPQRRLARAAGRLDGSGVFRSRRQSRRAQPTSRTSSTTQRALLVIQIDQDFERRLLAGPAGRRAGDRRRPQLQHRRHRDRLCRRDRRRLQRRLARRPRPARRRRCRSSMRAWYNPNLETRWNMIPSLIGTLTLHADAAADGHVGRPRARAGHVRPVAGHAVPARSRSWPARRCPRCSIGTHAGDHRSCWSRSSGSAFRSPARSSTLYAGLDAVPAGGGRHRAAASRRLPPPCSRRCSTLSWS